MSKGGKVPHTKMNIPNMSKNQYSESDAVNGHRNDQKHNPLHLHGLKGKSSTRSPNHN